MECLGRAGSDRPTQPVLLRKHAIIQPRHALHDAEQLVAVGEHQGVAAQLEEPNTLRGKTAEADLVNANFEVGNGVDALANSKDELVCACAPRVGVVAKETVEAVGGYVSSKDVGNVRADNVTSLSMAVF